MTVMARWTPDADISRQLAAWSHDPDVVNARKFAAENGRTLLQIRLDLGLLQMEVTGRPDGQRPYGCESLLDYFEARLVAFRNEHGTDRGFGLSPSQMKGLRDEAGMYYHRYLASFVLKDFDRVIIDTARNLRLLDFCRKYATEANDRQILEPYRPYILMMHTRARAAVLLAEGNGAEARSIVEAAISTIQLQLADQGRAKEFATAHEVSVLVELLDQLK